MKFILFVIFFFVIIFLMIINNNELHIFEKGDFNIFLNNSINWFKIFFVNVKSITGNIINQNWLPE